MKRDRILKIIFVVALIMLSLLEIYALFEDSHWKYDYIFTVALLSALFFLRKKINLHPFHYFLFSTFSIFHSVGIFGAYEWNLLGIEYDNWMHAFFGIVSSLIIFRMFSHINEKHGKSIRINKKTIVLLSLVLILGFSAFHELFEFGGALVFGEGEGVLFIGAGDLDEWDTQKDMLNNVVGGVIGLIGYLIFEKINRKKYLAKKIRKI